MKQFIVLIITLLVVPVSAIAQSKESGSDRWHLLNLMHSFERELSKLRPYLTSEEAFKDPKARPTIQKSIDMMEKLVKAERPSTFEDASPLSLNFSLMSYHVQRTKKQFEGGSFEQARLGLNATTNFCVSCHTQVPVPKASLGGFGSDLDDQAVTLENAEYLFITRRFDLALKQYDELIRKYPQKNLKADQLRPVFNRKLALFSRVMRDPNAAVLSFSKDLKNDKLPAEIQNSLRSWITSFEAWKTEKTKLEKLSTDKFMDHVRNNLPKKQSRMIAPSDSEVVHNLRLSGLLYEHLMKDSSGKYSQEIMYYLAQFEKQLGHLYWYSIYQSYLRECVMKYPQQKFTKACFDMYEQDVHEQYSGKAKIPEDVQSNLKVMKRNL